jgi:hypothetical protein
MLALIIALALLSPAPPQHRRRAPRRSKHTTKKMNTIEKGTWGGPHIQLDVTDGGASVQYDCAHGTIDERLTLDAAGRFDVRGTHAREHGGPVRIDEKESREAARYAGRVEGETMTLTVTLADSKEPLGTFTLKRGQTGRLFRCL